MKKEVLLVAYYFEPFKGVGSKRMSYWAHAFFHDSDYTCTVVTATPQTESKPGIYYIEDKGNSWQSKFMMGHSWMEALQKFFRRRELRFDFAIISGGPFGHFGLSHYLKKRYNCKIVLDFRDPFSRNSRFNTFFLKDYIKKKMEKSFLRSADHAITVNKYCSDLLLEHIPQNKLSIIENGYDERALDTIDANKFDDGATHIVYAGSFYDDRNPSIFLSTLTKYSDVKKRYIFHHIGEPSNFLDQFIPSDRIVLHGQKSYAETIAIMKKCSLGLLITSGEPMESTTKIYDYIGCGLGVLIVTSGEPRTGSIHSITLKNAGTDFWVRNQESEIHSFFKDYTERIYANPNRQYLSRRNGFLQLKKILGNL